MTQDERWLAYNGNKCFRFEERQVFERPWIIVLVSILLLATTDVEYLVNGSYYSLTLNVILFFFLFLWWTTIPLKANEAVIEKTVHKLMDDMVAALNILAGQWHSLRSLESGTVILEMKDGRYEGMGWRMIRAKLDYLIDTLRVERCYF